jgi:hypothetical protein
LQSAVCLRRQTKNHKMAQDAASKSEDAATVTMMRTKSGSNVHLAAALICSQRSMNAPADCSLARSRD